MLSSGGAPVADDVSRYIVHLGLVSLDDTGESEQVALLAPHYEVGVLFLHSSLKRTLGLPRTPPRRSYDASLHDLKIALQAQGV